MPDDHPLDDIGPRRQRELYERQMSGELSVPLSSEALERRAREHIHPAVYEYIASGAGTGSTLESNRTAFRRWQILPRILRDPTDRTLSVELFGERFRAPVMLAPIAAHSLVHEDAELATARAAASLDVPVVLSTVSSKPLETVAEELGETPRWFQLYWTSDPDVTASLLKRAEDAGYSAIVVTLDAQVSGWRERLLERGYRPFLEGDGVANFFSDPAFRESLARPPEDDKQAAIRRFTDIVPDVSVTWEDLDALRDHTDLPILLKGVLAPDDARRAVERGVDGLVVSNHGGRQIDGEIAALDALPGVSETVDGRVPVFFDSGIRRGPHVFKAIALGATAVLLGRPYIYGLAIAGEDGVREVLKNVLAELDTTLALSGRSSFRAVDRETIIETGDT